VIFRPTPIEPVKRPTLHDAKTIGNPTKDGDLLVVIGGVAFAFWRLPSGDWTGGKASTMGRGWELDERWLTAARGVAAEALRGAIMAAGEPGEAPSEIVRCPECERILSSSALVREAVVVSITCGPAHVVAFSDGFEVIFEPRGVTTSERAPDTSRSG
jgi:hypothetical protein